MGKRKKIGKIIPKMPSRFAKQKGKAPGTITYMGRRENLESVVNILDYNENGFNVSAPGNIDAIVSHKGPPLISWIDIVGLSDEAFIAKIGERFGLNPLVMEDIVNTNQRPKIDEYDPYIFGVFKMLYINQNKELVGEHIALVLLDNCVLVFQELEYDVFTGVRDRVTKKFGRIRSRGSDYLFFALLDSIVDNYFAVLEYLNDKIEVLEEAVYADPSPEVAQKIQELKKEVLRIRRWVNPVKEIINRLIDTDHPLIAKETKIFFRDVLDHSLEVNDSIQIYREMSMSLMEMYMSNMSNKMNEVMKVLTIMASIFIPLTFIAGIYGMNFDNMPELHYQYGYYVVWGVMIALFLGMLVYFRIKKWI